MRKTTDDGMDLVGGAATATEDRPAWTAPVIVCDGEHDGERWDGLS